MAGSWWTFDGSKRLGLCGHKVPNAPGNTICYTKRVTRAVIIYFLTLIPAFAWEANSGRICELVHAGEQADVRVTYDPAIAEYAIEITPQSFWFTGPEFAIRFVGPRGLTISTRRHEITGGGATLTVRDRGFGNVLDGIEFNRTASAILGDQVVTIDLDGAAPAVREFRACTMAVSA